MKFRKALSFAISYAIGIVYTKQAEKKTDVFQTFFGLLNNIEYMSDAIAGKAKYPRESGCLSHCSWKSNTPR